MKLTGAVVGCCALVLAGFSFANGRYVLMALNLILGVGNVMLAVWDDP